jgi:uncharacterized protein (TIGR03437 family)
VLVLLGNGDGTFTEGATYNVGPYAPSLVVGDFHGRGILDIVVADSGTNAQHGLDGNVLLLPGNGDGTFAAPAPIALPGGFAAGPYSLVAGDFNRDGKLDLAVGFEAGGLAVLLGRGVGTFLPPVSYAVNAATLLAGDVNGDGNLDLVVLGPQPGSPTGNELGYLAGNGDGSFGPPVIVGAPASPVALGDFNHDGKPDIAAVSAGLLTVLNVTSAPMPVTVVPATSFVPGTVAPDSIASAFGKNFPSPAPSVSVTDVASTTLEADVLFSSPSQINLVLPAGLDAGPATVTIASAGGTTPAQTARVVIAPAAPSLFTVNASGLAAAYVTQLEGGGALANRYVFSLQNGTYQPVPVDVTRGPTYLILFGTGVRNVPAVSVTWNYQALQVSYAGPQPSYPGLDQVNVFLPSSLAGSGCINLSIQAGSLSSNSVYFCIK